MIMEMYNMYLLSSMYTEIITNIPRLYLVRVLGSRANADDIEYILQAIEHKNIETLQ